MNFKATVILFLIALALGCYVFLIESETPTQEEITASKSRVFLYNFSSVDSLKIENWRETGQDERAD